MKMRVIIIFVFAWSSVISQNDSIRNYKWPYYGHDIPPYIGVLVGYEGLKTNNIQGGLAFNFVGSTIDPAIGGMIGGCLLYKQKLNKPSVYSFEAEAGMYGGVVAGINYNYNQTSVKVIHGIKPFVGMTFYNIQIFYGYSFYDSKEDIYAELRHNRITVRYIVPVIKLRKK